MTVHLTQDQIDALIAHGRREAPCECCGILIGIIEPDRIVVREVHAVANVWDGDRDDRFMLDPRAHLRLQREARERGLEIVGFYHSHPHGPPEPSAFDLELAWPEQAYVIVSLLGEGPESMKCWRLDEAVGRFICLPMVTA